MNKIIFREGQYQVVELDFKKENFDTQIPFLFAYEDGSEQTLDMLYSRYGTKHDTNQLYHEFASTGCLLDIYLNLDGSYSCKLYGDPRLKTAITWMSSNYNVYYYDKFGNKSYFTSEEELEDMGIDPQHYPAKACVNCEFEFHHSYDFEDDYCAGCSEHLQKGLAVQAPTPEDMKIHKHLCDVCKENEMHMVFASSCGPVSFAYCLECGQAGREPYGALLSYFSCAMDHKFHNVEDLPERWLKHAEPTLSFLGKSKEDFMVDLNSLFDEFTNMVLEF